MYTPEELKNQKDILAKIDWEMTPQEAFQTYQIKSINSWKQRDMEDAYYFAIYVRKGEPQVLLIKKTLKDSEELAQIPVPRSLVMASLPRKKGEDVPHGHYPLDKPVKDWIKRELGV